MLSKMLLEGFRAGYLQGEISRIGGRTADRDDIARGIPSNTRAPSIPPKGTSRTGRFLQRPMRQFPSVDGSGSSGGAQNGRVMATVVARRGTATAKWVACRQCLII
jgi:hypothetical protein